jgi:hypothetical protein
VKKRDAGAALGIAACVVGGCGVERTTAVEQIDIGTDDAGRTGREASIDVAADASSDGMGSSSSAKDGSDAIADLSGCTNPTCVVSNTGCSEGSGPDGSTYYLYDNQWNCGPGSGHNCGPEKLYGCSYNSWYVTSNQPAGNTAVLTYPDVQANFANNPLVSSFHAITSTFAETSPHVGVYEYAYDIWLNGVATTGSSQILIWVDNTNRVPAGSQVTTTTLGGRTYDVWNTLDNSHIVLVSTVPFTTGTVNLLEIVNWAITQGWLASGSTLGSIDFGVEIVSTDGASATYLINDFSIATN